MGGFCYFKKETPMQEIIKELLAERKQLKERVSAIDNAIEAFQRVCKHTFCNGEDAYKLTGRDSHKKHYTCQICEHKIYV